MTDFMGKALENPIIASSCIATETVRNVHKLIRNGVQGVILKSCADYKRPEISDTRNFAVDKSGLVYASSPYEKEILTLEECLGMLSKLRKKTDILLIPSFTASCLEPDAWLEPCKNVNLPKDFIMPVLVSTGVEYVSLLDSVRSPYLEEHDGKYSVSGRLDSQTTSCFGHWQLPLTLGYTYTAAQYGLKVCAGGGVTSADDVRKLLAAGAVTVQSASFLTKYPDKVFELYPDISTETLPPKGGSVSVRCVAGQPKGFA